jgi:two-component system chemotaxis sensor kinase CheA
MLRITDDGAGLDTDAILSRAVAKGLAGPDDRLTEKEIQQIIFAPGFSTAEGVTSISGRGVGMDVVKRAVESLRGSIHVESITGRRTTITLILPLTLAIIEGLLVRVGEDFYVLPLSSVEECVELTRRNPQRSGGRHLIRIREQAVPYVRLREQFSIGGEPPVIEQVVIAREDSRTIGLVVDEVVGQHQTVIRTLGRVFKDVEGISGATILGDGSVALILDIPKLLAIAEEEEAEWTGGGCGTAAMKVR